MADKGHPRQYSRASTSTRRDPSASHVALFLPALRGGGAERVMVNLARDFARRGLKVDLVLAKAEGPYMMDVPKNVCVVDLDVPRVLRSLPGLFRYLRRERPDAMLSTLSNANVVALLARKLAGSGVRTVVREASMLRLGESLGKQPRGRCLPFLMKRLYPSADAVVVLSSMMADELEHGLGVQRKKIVVIPNSADHEELQRKAQEPVDHRWMQTSRVPIVLAVGRLDVAKDYPTLIRAFADLQTSHPSRLIILGEGDERTILEALVQRLGIADRVDMPGFVSNPYAFMKQASVVVSSSRWEGSPNVVIEAVALGCKVVATDCGGGMRDALHNGDRGVLVPIEQPTALCEGLRAALQGQREPKNSEAGHTYERFIDQYLEVLGVD